MEQEDFNIREHQLTSKERDFENALRPLSFEDFSGQDKVVENLRIFVKAARLRGEALDHVLLHGPPADTKIGDYIIAWLAFNIKFRETFLSH